MSRFQGFYIIASDVDDNNLDTAETRKSYKRLAHVEQAFRTMKTTELSMRPIRHWNAKRVKGHIFLCMLSYLIIWDMRKKLESFISHEPIKSTQESENPEDACHSLRTIFETLDKEVQIGTLKVGDFIKEEISPIKEKSRKILTKLNAMPTKKRTKRLAFVG